MGKGFVTMKPIDVDLTPEIFSALVDVGEDVVAILTHTSPVRAGRSGGKYAKGWEYKINMSEQSVTVFNSGKHKSLTHLLELGHLNRDGSFWPGDAHILPAYEWGKAVYMYMLKEIKF